jgi:hypothetical protein
VPPDVQPLFSCAGLPVFDEQQRGLESLLPVIMQPGGLTEHVG